MTKLNNTFQDYKTLRRGDVIQIEGEKEVYTVVCTESIPSIDGEVLFICLNRATILLKKEQRKTYKPFQLVGFHTLEKSKRLELEGP